MTGDLSIVKQGLIDRAGEVARQLLPRGRMEGPLWVSFNPVLHDDKPGREPALKVRVRGGDVGAWRDWRSGDKGDILGLAAYVLTGNVKNTREALAWGRDFLGLQKMSREERAAMARAGEKRRAEEADKDEKRRAAKLLEADRLFNGRPGPHGPAIVPQGACRYGENGAVDRHVEAYFAGRSIDLAGMTHRNALTFKTSAATEWWKGATWKSDAGRRWKEEPGPLYPALHSAMRNRMGIVTCCHVTFLDPVEPKKAPVQPAKLMFGEALGSVIEISTGPSGIPFWQADRDGVIDPLIIAEGIETAASFSAEIPEARVWAAGSLAGVGAAPIDLDCVEWVLFARDNNEGNAQAQKQFERALAGLESHGKGVFVRASHVGDDFNNLAQGEE